MQDLLSQTHHIGVANQTEWKLYNTGKDYQWSCVDDNIESPVIFSRITEQYSNTPLKTPEDVFFFKFRRAGKFVLQLSNLICKSLSLGLKFD